MVPCFECEKKMFPLFQERCTYCSQDLAGCDNPCPECRENPPVVDGMRALGGWNGPLREWLSELKYGGDARMAVYLSGKLYEIWETQWKGIPVVPVPPRMKRLFQTGIDPVNLLLSGMQNKSVNVVKLLMRRGNGTQKSLDRKERLDGNKLKYRLRADAELHSAEYVLLDDVSTTGATLRICASVLKAAGARKVYGLVVCKD